MAPAAQIINQPEVIAGRLPLAVDLQPGRAGSYDEGEFGLGLGGHSVKSVVNCPKTVRKVQLISEISI